MGVTGGSKLLYHISGLTFGHVACICRKRAEEAGRVGSPAVAADMSWLCHRLRRSAGSGETTKLIIALISKFVSEGFLFYAVYDPEERHHSKKASIYREFERQQSIAECIKVKTKLLSISQDLRHCNFQNKDDEKILRSNLKSLESKAKKAEKTLADSRELPEIVMALYGATRDLAQEYPRHVMVVEGKFQADSLIQYFLSTKTIDLAIGNDTDFSVISGDACIQLSNFNINVKNGKNAAANIENITIASGWKSTINKVHDYLGPNVGNFEEAKMPLLDNIKDIRTRCLIAVLLSNDTFPPALKSHTFLHGIGAATVRDAIAVIRNGNSNSDVAFDILLDAILSKIKKRNKNQGSKTELPRFVIKAFVEAMAYEPSSITDTGKLLYSETGKKCRNNDINEHKHIPIIQPESISDKEVKERTGFESLILLVCFIAIVCDGDIDTMTETRSRMTWLEEWFFYFEMIWGRSILHWVDGQRHYKIHDEQLRDVFKHKLSMVIKAVSKWPRYAHHSEDMELRSENWRERYANKRVIMWDNTNVDFQGKPALADLQRLTYSLYYGGNVAKGAVFLQLCGWLGGWELWLGAISDTNYFEDSGILEFQEMFQKNDPSSDLSFTNIPDKGYRSILAAWRTGGQLLLQPFFARSDRKFTSREVLLSGAVASDRSGNERAVHQLKRSYMLSRGIHTRQDFDRFADIWIAWGFQCNFMFKPVL